MVIEIIYRKEGLFFCRPGDRRRKDPLPEGETPAGMIGRILADTKKTTASVVIFVSEELLFFTSFSLPLRTPHIKEALLYQLEQLVPLEEGSYYHSYSSSRREDGYHLCLYALHRRMVEKDIRQIAEAGYAIAGLYPESQRYVNRGLHKENWSLVVPGDYTKVFSFSGLRLEERSLCYGGPDFSALAEAGGGPKIFHVRRPIGSSFLDADDLLEEKPVLKAFNLLPASYRRPDYYRKIIFVLLVLNAITFLGLVGVREGRLIYLGNRVEHEIARINPLVKEMKKLQKDEESYKSQIDQLTGLGKNPDLIKFLSDLSAKLPRSSYLDQMRLNKKEGSIQLQGYTEDIGQLTAKLKGLGETKLKSTSRRRNKTYFQVEISLP